MKTRSPIWIDGHDEVCGVDHSLRIVQTLHVQNRPLFTTTRPHRPNEALIPSALYAPCNKLWCQAIIITQRGESLPLTLGTNPLELNSRANKYIFTVASFK